MVVIIGVVVVVVGAAVVSVQVLQHCSWKISHSPSLKITAHVLSLYTFAHEGMVVAVVVVTVAS